MNIPKQVALSSFSILALLAMSGCDRDTYTTWSCIDSAGSKSTMVLKKAQMQFQDHQYDYCGSLGPQSYFDMKCPAQIQESNYSFTPSSGKMLSSTNEYQCNAL
ncbi:hypothetical protein [Polynucleobacter sp. UK-Mo-2m-Kol15]|uniref:hypothetical protein n=1 Tax=Polynucleobacter sp. UK-Mo-2m-Kol15 TaxID=2576916 RepID=UPI001C0C057F|nr:hypothetical protein [Polynucleobacter sp. UK-Mo-2m-Kol15]